MPHYMPQVLQREAARVRGPEGMARLELATQALRRAVRLDPREQGLRQKLRQAEEQLRHLGGGAQQTEGQGQ
jgi:hypothetical protein